MSARPFALEALTSLALPAASNAVSIVLGLTLAVVAEGRRWQRIVAGLYTWLFRGAPAPGRPDRPAAYGQGVHRPGENDALASAISLQELLAVTSRTISVTFHFTELYAVALTCYLAIVSALMLGQVWAGAAFVAFRPCQLRPARLTD